MKTKNLMTIFGAMLFISLITASCGDSVTVCECLKDDGSKKEQCDALAEDMTDAELSSAMDDCQ
ncbi:MAG: hypothetical protein QNK78_07595 [Crocinitomicaceae bacterium]|tara:strand:- start:448 stop:639 length:192 start_codon:yes stop_codon:yes gene_type:complete